MPTFQGENDEAFSGGEGGDAYKYTFSEKRIEKRKKVKSKKLTSRNLSVFGGEGGISR